MKFSESTPVKTGAAEPDPQSERFETKGYYRKQGFKVSSTKALSKTLLSISEYYRHDSELKNRSGLKLNLPENLKHLTSPFELQPSVSRGENATTQHTLKSLTSRVALLTKKIHCISRPKVSSSAAAEDPLLHGQTPRSANHNPNLASSSSLQKVFMPLSQKMKEKLCCTFSATASQAKPKADAAAASSAKRKPRPKQQSQRKQQAPVLKTQGPVSPEKPERVRSTSHSNRFNIVRLDSTPGSASAHHRRLGDLQRAGLEAAFLQAERFPRSSPAADRELRAHRPEPQSTHALDRLAQETQAPRQTHLRTTKPRLAGQARQGLQFRRQEPQ